MFLGLRWTLLHHASLCHAQNQSTTRESDTYVARQRT
jgi:hypothetical protein